MSRPCPWLAAPVTFLVYYVVVVTEEGEAARRIGDIASWESTIFSLVIISLGRYLLLYWDLQCLAKVFGPLELCDLLPHFRLQT